MTNDRNDKRMTGNVYVFLANALLGNISNFFPYNDFVNK